jgi:hypothetical protein
MRRRDARQALDDVAPLLDVRDEMSTVEATHGVGEEVDGRAGREGFLERRMEDLGAFDNRPFAGRGVQT